MNLQRDLVEFPLAAQCFGRQDRLATLATAALLHLQRAADDGLDQAGAVDVADQTGLDEAAVAKDRVAVGDLENFGKTVRHVDDAGALCGHAADGAEQDFGLLLANGRGGFVHDHHIAVVAEGLGNFHQLHLGQAQVLHASARIDLELQAIQQRLRLPFHGAGVDAEPCHAGLAAEVEIFCHAHAGDGRELLRDDGDVVMQGFGRRMEIHRLALEADLAAIPPQQAHDDGQEGRFAGTVAAAQRMHAAALQLQASVGQRHDLVEGLAHSMCFQQKLCHGCLHTCAGQMSSDG